MGKLVDSFRRLRVTPLLTGKTHRDSGRDNGLNRYSVSKTLQDLNIAHRIWLEDVLATYGSDTQVWHVSVLVQDPSLAASTLHQAGYELSAAPRIFVDDPEFSGKGICIRRHGSDLDIMLYHAKDWYYDLESGMSGMPPLAAFLDSIMAMWLDISSQDFDDRLAFSLHISCLIIYCYQLTDPLHGEVKSEAYAAHLRKQHRQLHLDIVNPPNTPYFATAPGHTYQVRRANEIRQGLWEPQPNEKGRYQQQLVTLKEQNDPYNSELD